ncbi:NnrU family protein [Litoribrevibacter albus]|uniref:NnrU domain-containing protein n=1 Tax=Litoribrevibacter albus TaxID=1473156 RepID=A0AA37W6C7_9GAMM|nr:NnrU family protein [Litoribrevibacter albus]GLQ30208.1 hypothetical protein GCM10007876_06860 [Litoribrevibacter albus]
MTFLLTGMLVFYSIHLVPHLRSVRGQLTNQLGFKTYHTAFILWSAVGLSLMVYGKSTVEYVHLWNGFMSLRHLTYFMVLAFFILLMAVFIPCNLRRWVHHPMLLGFLMWSVGHLLVNGDLGSTLFFGGFAVYSLFSLVSEFVRGKRCQLPKQLVWKDGLVITSGALIYVLVAKSHGMLFDVPLM